MEGTAAVLMIAMVVLSVEWGSQAAVVADRLRGMIAPLSRNKLNIAVVYFSFLNKYVCRRH